MKSQGLFESQGGPIILSQVLLNHFPFYCIGLLANIARQTGEINIMILVLFWFSFLFFHVFCQIWADWKWIWSTGGVLWWCRSQELCKLGCSNGSWPQDWCAMGHVQTRWCTRSNCKFKKRPFYCLEFSLHQLFCLLCIELVASLAFFFFLLICHIARKTLFIFLLQLFLFNIKFLDLYTNWNKNGT